jgi:hypothetical protein
MEDDEARGGSRGHHHDQQQQHEQQRSLITAADVYRLACAEFSIEPHDALLAALEGREDGGAAAVAAVGGNNDEWEEGTRAVTLRVLVRTFATCGGLITACSSKPTHTQDEPHVCAVALTVSHLQQEQSRRGGRRLRLRLHLPECTPGREGMRQLGMALAGRCDRSTCYMPCHESPRASRVSHTYCHTINPIYRERRRRRPVFCSQSGLGGRRGVAPHFSSGAAAGHQVCACVGGSGKANSHHPSIH